MRIYTALVCGVIMGLLTRPRRLALAVLRLVGRPTVMADKRDGTLFKYFAKTKDACEVSNRDRKRKLDESIDLNARGRDDGQKASAPIHVPVPGDVALLRDGGSSLAGTTSAIKAEKVLKIWVPDAKYDFPGIVSHGKKRRFRYTWLETYEWLAYSPSQDAAFCKYCVAFAPPFVGKSGLRAVGLLASIGFRNWKRAVEQFSKHQSTEYHYHAYSCFCQIQREKHGAAQSIESQLNTAKQQQAEQNRRRLEPIIKTVIFCGRQGIALRGHRDSGQISERESESNDGNFRALLRFRIDSGDTELREHLTTSSKNATYVSWKIQNEILSACNTIIVSKIVAAVNEAKCFSVLADETSDVSITEQFSVSVRFFDENKGLLTEQFLQFVPVVDTTGRGLATTLMAALSGLGVELSYLRGQGYDGAAAMSGRMSGVQKFVADKYPNAIYVHCASHSLNLAIGNAVDIPEIRNCFGTVEKVCTFFSYPKRSAVLKEMIESSSKKTKLKHFSPTRWIERHDSILVMAELFDFIIMSLDKISTWRDRDTSSFSSILERAMTAPNFIVALYSIEKLFSYTLPLSRLLQTVNCDLAKALQHVTVTTNAIKKIRANVEAAFSEIYEKARRKFSELGVTESMPRRMPVEQENPEMFYRRTLFVPFCDHIITQLESRFEKHSAIVSSFLALLHRWK